MKKIITLLIALCIVLGCVTTPPFATLADETREFDSVDVLDDLTSSKDENGNAFDLTDYPYDENGRVRDRKSTRLNSSHYQQSRMPSSA